MLIMYSWETDKIISPQDLWREACRRSIRHCVYQFDWTWKCIISLWK
jgi:hypothetical protein